MVCYASAQAPSVVRVRPSEQRPVLLPADDDNKHLTRFLSGQELCKAKVKISAEHFVKGILRVALPVHLSAVHAEPCGEA